MERPTIVMDLAIPEHLEVFIESLLGDREETYNIDTVMHRIKFRLPTDKYAVRIALYRWLYQRIPMEEH